MITVFLKGRFYILMALSALVMAAGMLWQPLLGVGLAMLVALLVATVADIVLAYTTVRLKAWRTCPQRLSLGDENKVTLHFRNYSLTPLRLKVIDELPVQLQQRDFRLDVRMDAKDKRTMDYSLRPTSRGEYGFGNLLVYVSTPLQMAERRMMFDAPFTAKVYPSFVKLHRHMLTAAPDKNEVGQKRVRRAGNNTEFEQIKDYVQGDEYRTINWKASARRSHLMVNVYEDERSQQIFSLIDRGRLMQQAFGGLTLLDHAINASLVLSYVAVMKHDKAGLITFDYRMGSFVPASRQTGQIQRIMESLYKEKTSFGESDYSMLCPNVGRLVGRRSFMVLYTNFTDFGSMARQLPYLKLLNRRHRLLVVFFMDTELEEFISTPQKSVEDCYQHVIAEKMVYERRLIVNTLKQNGIYSLLTTPSNLSVDVVNKYMEMKSRNLLV